MSEIVYVAGTSGTQCVSRNTPSDRPDIEKFDVCTLRDAACASLTDR